MAYRVNAELTAYVLPLCFQINYTCLSKKDISRDKLTTQIILFTLSSISTAYLFIAIRLSSDLYRFSRQEQRDTCIVLEIDCQSG